MGTRPLHYAALCIFVSLITLDSSHSISASEDSADAAFDALVSAADSVGNCSKEMGYLTAADRSECNIRRSKLLSLEFQGFAKRQPQSQLADDALHYALILEIDASTRSWRSSPTDGGAPGADGAARVLDELLSRYPDSELCSTAIQEFVSAFERMDHGNSEVGRIAERLMFRHREVDNAWSLIRLLWPYYLESLRFDELVDLMERMKSEYAATAPMPHQEARAVAEMDLERVRKWRAEYLLTCVAGVLAEYERLNFGYPPGRYYSWGLLYDLIAPYGKHMEGQLDQMDPFTPENYLEFVIYESNGADYNLKARITLDSEVGKLREIGPETRTEPWSKYPVWKIDVLEE
jgi:hypothetical protein